MPVLATATIVLYIIRTTEIMDILISGVHMIPQLMPALGTDKKITECVLCLVLIILSKAIAGTRKKLLKII